MQIGNKSCRYALNFAMKSLNFLFDLKINKAIFFFALSHLKKIKHCGKLTIKE